MEELGALAAEAQALSLATFMVCANVTSYVCFAVFLLCQGHKL